MALIECSECKKEISNQAQSCPHCGSPLVANNQDSKSKKKGGISFIIKILIAILIFFFFVLMIGSSENSPKTSGGSRKVVSKQKQKSFIDLSCSSFTDTFGSSSSLSDMQKDARFKKYKNQWVRWKGEVVEVSKGMLGGLTLTIKCSSKSLISDAIVQFDSSFESQLMNLTKGKSVKFEGQIENWGSLLPHVVKGSKVN